MKEPVARGTEGLVYKAICEKISSDFSQLARAIERCGKCGARSRGISGAGRIGARVMAIAGVPGPGAEAGNPWGGWSRGFLEKAGGVLDLEPEDIYLATALRCPVEQASLPDLRRCVPYMAEEISILAPRLILASGKVAAVALRMALGARCPERPKAGDVAKSASGRILFDLDIARTAGDENARRIFWEILGTGRDLL